MSKNSPKQLVEQLKDWLAWRKANAGSSFIGAKKPKRKFSKSEHYSKTRKRYGYNKSN